MSRNNFSILYQKERQFQYAEESKDMEKTGNTQYTGFASVYDMFMDNVPYDEWADYLHKLLLKKGIDKGIICELGCGTGKVTRKLKSFGYDMI